MQGSKHEDGSSGDTTAPPRSPDSYTPKHLPEKILLSKSALEGERKQVTVLFADLKGSMELLTVTSASASSTDRRASRRQPEST